MASYNTGGKMTDLGTLGGQGSWAVAINDSGQVVGDAQTGGGGADAFLYQHGVMIDLNRLLPKGSGWSLGIATAINDAGQIVGSGEHNGESHAFLLTLGSDIAATSASTTDARNITLNYSISGSDLSQPFRVAVYRSPTPTFDINTAVPTGLQATIPATDSNGASSLTQGPHTVTVTLPSPIGPDTSGNDPYVFVVANPPGTNHIPESDDPTDANDVTPLGLPDLAVSIDSTEIVPTQATDLNLYHFFGTEQVNIPVSIENKGTGEAKGDAEVTVYLSPTTMITTQRSSQTTRTKSPSASRWISNFDLQGGGQTSVAVSGTIAGSRLQIGQQYYFLCQITSPTIKESDATSDGTDSNNIAATDRTFEFVGTPGSNPSVFDDGTYFRFIRETLQDPTSAATEKASQEKVPPINVADMKSFIGLFEGDSLSPYLDGNGHPTIGVGINIDAQMQVTKSKKGKVKTVVTPLGKMLAEDVKKYKKLKKMSDVKVLKWLGSQAKNAHWTKANQGPPFMSSTDDNDLF